MLKSHDGEMLNIYCDSFIKNDNILLIQSTSYTFKIKLINKY